MTGKVLRLVCPFLLVLGLVLTGCPADDDDPRIEISDALIELEADVGESASRSFTIANRGEADLEFAFSFDDEALTLTPMSGTLGENRTREVVATGACLEVGTFSIPVRLDTNDPERRRVDLVVRLSCLDPDEVVFGALEVTIVGLPDEIEANVEVAGPQDFARTLTETTLLEELVPGTYTLIAAEVETAEGVFEAVEEQVEVVVESDALATMTIVYELVAEPVPRGTLVVTITGLPDDVDADVFVSGPSGRRTFTETATLRGLRVGEYTAVASEVAVEGGIYEPSPQETAATVVDSETVEMSIAYTFAPVDPDPDPDPDPTVFTVISEANSGEGSLRAILEAAPAGSTIDFATGVELIIVESPLVVERDVTIAGPGRESLRISAGLFGRIFEIASDADVEMSGLSLIRGAAERGAAVWNQGSLLLSNCLIDEHEAELGGAIFNTGRLDMRDCVVTRSVAEAGGGAIYNEGSLFLRTAVFEENEAGTSGGAIYSTGTVEIVDTRLAGNLASDDGGAVASLGALMVELSFIEGNDAARGGAMYAEGRLFVTTTVFLANRATIAGAGIAAFGETTIEESTFSNQEGSNPGYDPSAGPAGGTEGGAVYNAGSLEMTNTTLISNFSNVGAGLFNAGQAVLAQVTIALNFGEYGIGLAHLGVTGVVTQVRGSVIAQSFVTQSSADVLVIGDTATTVTSLGYNVIGLGAPDSGFEDGVMGDIVGTTDRIDAGIRPAGYVGGPTPTANVIPGFPAFAHVPAGACLDARGEPLTIDQRGEPRPVALSCDAGAFQTQYIEENFEGVPDLPEVGEGSFVGTGYVTWTYNGVRDATAFPIDGRGLLLAGEGSFIRSEPLPDGIARLRVEMRKAFASGEERQLELRVNGDVVGTSQIFNGTFGVDETVHTFGIADIGIPGEVVIEIRNLTPGEVTIDNLRWDPFEGD